MIRVLALHYLGEFRLELTFSDGKRGIFDASPLLEREGSLLVPLRDEQYFGRVFIDAGALCWPNGLELSPDRVSAQSRMLEAA